jgi:hypothetical protein
MGEIAHVKTQQCQGRGGRRIEALKAREGGAYEFATAQEAAEFLG